MIYSVLGEPVEKCDDVDYVPTGDRACLLIS